MVFRPGQVYLALCQTAAIGRVSAKNEGKVTDMRGKASLDKGILGASLKRGQLSLTETSLEYFPPGVDELARKPAFEIPLDDIVYVGGGRFRPHYPLWIHILLFPLPLLMKLMLAPFLGLFIKSWLELRTASSRYSFGVGGGAQRRAWVDAINARRAEL